MTKLRNENLVLVYGDYELLLPDHEQIYSYTRILGEDKMLVLLNFSDQNAEASLSESMEQNQILVNNYDTSPIKADSKILLEPYQAVIVKIK